MSPVIDPETRQRANLAFDWDGVVHIDPCYRASFAAMDFTPLTMAHSQGYAVTIMTCNDTWRIAAALRAAGFLAEDDSRMRHLFWDGGRTGKVVLVTGRKVSAVAYLDDKGVNATYGCDWAAKFREVRELVARRRRTSVQDPLALRR